MDYSIKLEVFERIVFELKEQQKKLDKAYEAGIDLIDFTGPYKNEKLFRQKVDFTGLKDGIYVVRIASHWCSYGDKLGKGEAYDLDNGLTWQKTSTNIYKVNNEENVFPDRV